MKTPMAIFARLNEWERFVSFHTHIENYYNAQKRAKQSYARIFILLEEPAKEADDASNGLLWAEYVLLGKRIQEMEEAFGRLEEEKKWLADRGGMLESRDILIEKRAGKSIARTRQVYEEAEREEARMNA